MYNHKEIEQKWQKYWEENKTFTVKNDFSKPKYYTLDMFPYPSWAGLHVGHPEGMTANDIVARYKTAKGFNVLHPMGWDAFWLPAENYAIKTGTHPRITTDENIANFTKQIKALGFSYDWDREIDTTDPAYYKWTQWIFLKLFEKGLAYEQNLPINYCPSCKTGLANEEVLNDFTCERCHSKVEKKKIRQWVLGITKYADRLLTDVDKLDWPEGIKDMQRNWIGKSEGCEFSMKVVSPPLTPPLYGEGDNSLPPEGGKMSERQMGEIQVYTTRIDTVFGMTYAVLAPDHKDVEVFITEENKAECEAYIEAANKQSDQDRTADNKEKTWVFTWSYVINPFNSQEVPLWIWDYVLGNYWTWAVMAVPAHDVRDFEFAKKYDLEIVQSILKYVTYDWIKAPKKEVETLVRNTIDVIVENDKWEFLLQLEEDGKETHCHFVWGWIEEWDTELETVSKELTEETWYTDFEIIWPLNLSYKWGKSFRHTKNKNQDTIWRFFHIKLNSENQIESELADWKHTIEWVKKENVLQRITWNNHADAWNLFINWEKAFTDLWVLVNSWKFDRLDSKTAQKELVQFAEEKWFGTKKVNYKLRDWLFSRQRYWGEPIPLVHCDDCWIVGEKEENLPILLPETDNFEPSGDGTSPLTKIDSFVNCECPKCGKPAKRETNTMPQWWGSCWYYLRYMDPNNSEKLVDPEVEKYWGQVDSYVGWAEHAVLHLLYARFWHKFLFDIGIVSHDEPFYRLRNQGLILAYSFEDSNWKLIPTDEVVDAHWEMADQDNLIKEAQYFEKATGKEVKVVVAKMSKSLKNVVNPDKIVEQYWADSLRLYEMYMADFKDTAPWDTKNIVWVRRFLDKSERLFTPEAKISTSSDDDTLKLLHKTIKKIEEDIGEYKFNTAIAALMILVNNGLPQDIEVQKQWREMFCILLNPFAPHLAEELWERMHKESESIHLQAWPEFDEKLIVDDTINIWVQVLGKLRWTIEIAVDEPKNSVLEKAKSEVNVAKWIEWKSVVKEIYVPGKIVNLVVK